MFRNISFLCFFPFLVSHRFPRRLLSGAFFRAVLTMDALAGRFFVFCFPPLLCLSVVAVVDDFGRSCGFPYLDVGVYTFRSDDCSTALASARSFSFVVISFACAFQSGMSLGLWSMVSSKRVCVYLYDPVYALLSSTLLLYLHRSCTCNSRHAGDGPANALVDRACPSCAPKLAHLSKARVGSHNEAPCEPCRCTAFGLRLRMCGMCACLPPMRMVHVRASVLRHD